MVKRAVAGASWEPPVAQDWNSIGESTEVYHREQRDATAAQKKQWIIPTEWMFCRNGTGDRDAGEVLEAGDYLLDEFDPFSLWFVGQAPTDPVRKSTHGVLRVACKDGKLERVQVSGIVRALVNVTDTDHQFCDAAAGYYVLQSNDTGPHKIVYKPTGTGEKTCAVLLYAAAEPSAEFLAKAELNADMCPADFGGTGTGSEGQTVAVINARYYPSCVGFTPTRVVNPRNHRGPLGATVTMIKIHCSGEDEEWEILDVELQKYCAVVGMEDQEGCFTYWSLRLGGEWCPADEPTEKCIAIEYEPCPGDAALAACDISLIFDPLYACCWLHGSGS